ncbi:hypothetical protein D3C72_1351680 [compost metagenome]
MREVALAVEERHGAPGRTHRVVVLGLVADGDRGAVGHVAFQHGHAGHLVLFVAVVIEIAIGVGGDHAAAEAAVGGQWCGHVRLHAAVVPAAGTDRERGVELLARALAQQVHRGRRHAGAAEQAVGTADHFHPVVEGGVVFLVGRAAVGGNAVHLEIGDGKAARVVQRALGVIEGHADAGHVAHHVVDAEQRLVLQPLQPDRGSRLRGLLQGHRQAGGAGRCGARANHADLVQGLGVGMATGRIGGGVGQGQRRGQRQHGEQGQAQRGAAEGTGRNIAEGHAQVSNRSREGNSGQQAQQAGARGARR